MSEQRVSASRRIAAPAHTIYEIVADPAGHVAIDGSGMLDLAPGSQPLTSVGDTFIMDMDRTPLGDIPGLVKYQVQNTVTAIEPDRLVEWTIGGVGQPPFGHVYGWKLDPVSDTETDVTNYCDWTNITPELRERRPDWPIVPVEMLEESVANLDRLLTGGDLEGTADITVETEELDADGDGKVDAVRETTTMVLDVDGDGSADVIEQTTTTLVDMDGDGKVDAIEQTTTRVYDLDGDGTPDVIEQTTVIGLDADGDGEIDDSEITIERTTAVREGFVDGEAKPLDRG